MRELLVYFVMFFFTWGIIYFLFANTIYVVLLILAFRDIRKNQLQNPFLLKELKATPPSFAPGISLIAPAYNEGKNIVASVKSFLMLNYPNFEIVVVNDGSKDDTLEQLLTNFKMYEEHLYQDTRLKHAEIKKTYRSATHPNLVVVDKFNGGAKADASNAGLAVAKNTLFCGVDSDSILEDDSLLRVALPFFEDPERTIAAGGTIRVVNGSIVKQGRMVKPILSKQFLVLMQNVEYIRSFLCGRVGWNAMNGTLMISGAFGLFNKEAVISIGGYNKDSLGEDLEVVVKLHKYYTNVLKKPYKIAFIPDPICWTEVPFDWATLQKQRVRWQRGLAETMAWNRDLMHPKYGALGLVTVPYFFFIELWGPIVEIVSWIVVLLAYWLGVLNTEYLLLFFLIGIFYGMLMTLMALLMEEVFYRKRSSISEFVLLFMMGVIETFGYRQVTMFWRLKGIWMHYKGAPSIWGDMNRGGLN